MLSEGPNSRERVWDPVSHFLAGLDMGWDAESCCERRALLKMGTSLMDIAAVQEVSTGGGNKKSEGLQYEAG